MTHMEETLLALPGRETAQNQVFISISDKEIELQTAYSAHRTSRVPSASRPRRANPAPSFSQETNPLLLTAKTRFDITSCLPRACGEKTRSSPKFTICSLPTTPRDQGSVYDSHVVMRARARRLRGGPRRRRNPGQPTAGVFGTGGLHGMEDRRRDGFRPARGAAVVSRDRGNPCAARRTACCWRKRCGELRTRCAAVPTAKRPCLRSRSNIPFLVRARTCSTMLCSLNSGGVGK